MYWECVWNVEESRASRDVIERGVVEWIGKVGVVYKERTCSGSVGESRESGEGARQMV
jgi:hypothetical protein